MRLLFKPVIAVLAPVMLVLPLALFAPGAGSGAEKASAAADPSPASNSDSQDADPYDGGQWHRVSSGETLRDIARRYYGTARQWRILQVANDAGMSPPAGSHLWIPGSMPDLP